MKKLMILMVLGLAIALASCSSSSDAKDTVGQDTAPDTAAGDASVDLGGADAAGDAVEADNTSDDSIEADTIEADQTEVGEADITETDAAEIQADVDMVLGEISATGSLVLADAPLAAMNGALFAVALLPADYELIGDPAPDILAAIPVTPGDGYTGTEIEIPAEGNVFMTWNPLAENPFTDVPFAAAAGTYSLLVAMNPDPNGEGGPSHIYFAEIEIPEVPMVLELGKITLNPLN